MTFTQESRQSLRRLRDFSEPYTNLQAFRRAGMKANLSNSPLQIVAFLVATSEAPALLWFRWRNRKMGFRWWWWDFIAMG
ncbi:hypothetical protein ACFX2I_046538 [Malus domestica]